MPEWLYNTDIGESQTQETSKVSFTSKAKARGRPFLETNKEKITWRDWNCEVQPLGDVNFTKVILDQLNAWN